MPIDRDRYEQLTADALGIAEGSNADAGVSFLAESSDQAFTRQELRDGVGVPDNSIGPVAEPAPGGGLVEHRGRY